MFNQSMLHGEKIWIGFIWTELCLLDPFTYLFWPFKDLLVIILNEELHNLFWNIVIR